MIGIVIVSHSAKLAAGVQELASQMVQGEVKIAVAAGIDDPENPFGTDPIQVHQAIESVYSDDGVIVLMDLGSAVLSAEMALEFLSEEQQNKVKLCEAPLVEGAIAAVVQAANGADIEQVLTEARGALAAKASQLGNPPLSSPPVHGGGNRKEFSPADSVQNLFLSSPPVDGGGQRGGSKEIYLTIKNRMGLHARPAAKFVATAGKFKCEITVRNVSANSDAVNAKSINQLVTLAVCRGDEIAIAASGSDADEALAALQQLVENNFGESLKDSATPPLFSSPTPPLSRSSLSAIPASPGIAIGRVFLYQQTFAEIEDIQVDNPQTEWQKLHAAIATAHGEIEMLRQNAATEAGEQEAAIFDAHLLCLEDPTVLEAARQRIFEYGLPGTTAWKVVIDKTARTYEALADPFLQARSADVRDVGQRVLRLLTGLATAPLNLPEPAILVANDLSPSETAQLDKTKVLGICTVSGSANSHSGILARSLGIPAVMGVSEELLHLENGTLIVLDGETGEVWVQPDEAQLRELQAKRDSRLAAQIALKEVAQKPAITSDKREIKVMANIGSIADAKVAVNAGAAGVGLLRSEFLYFHRHTPPTEAEQLQIYEAIAATISPHPLIIRTLDIGGDKPISYLHSARETNPFLGWRGIRFSLDYPDLLKIQLRAILRTTHQYKIKVMFPMVASVTEIRAAKKILATAQAELRQAGILFDETMAVGVMVEVPAAVICADKLAAEVDFFSIGTNDLSQYIMASDRTNPKVANLADAFAPAVLRSIAQTVQIAHNAGIWVGVCGELASHSNAVPILVGLGVDELSVNTAAIPAIKTAISQLTMAEAEAIATAVLQLDSAAAVREYLEIQKIKPKV
ncbi:phosphoenolpyruvate--protein phosphotransferase [Aerosakkonema sp. BLCC-F183]|uniref:phosphoenolpyruvate--protein phosphotransferase n=1 Tax=Aerosakkonema sp. BLCC-F183 TaxID=3342834 RepID=UPI0035B8518D